MGIYKGSISELWVVLGFEGLRFSGYGGPGGGFQCCAKG